MDLASSNQTDSSADGEHTTDFDRSTQFSKLGNSAPVESPEKIGDFLVERLLGQGGFGCVYLAQDLMLQRKVAIKVPHAHFVSLHDEEALQETLQEARKLARLDHPSIVPVHQVGHTDDIPCFIVSKYIEGCSLKEIISRVRLSQSDAIQLVIDVADALQYTHTHGLVHRDVKPSNVMMDNKNRPFLTDFGLALSDDDRSIPEAFVGTAPYMSPEQARGEGHLVDGRADIFSLSVMLYELLTGTRPFRGDSLRELVDRICNHEPRPPRQLDDSISKSLEQVCLKALSKRATSRYTTALDFATELKECLAESDNDAARPSAMAISIQPSFDSTQIPYGIIPKGLRAFDRSDADFFMKLLPGPYDRIGLPESIRFWKSRIQETDPDETFRTGLIYGPSGCGKSSFVRAGLFAQLDRSVHTILVEATGSDLESRLAAAIRKDCPEVPDGDLASMIASIRRGNSVPSADKLLLVIDQFEQWLHTWQHGSDEMLIDALRQCDGQRVQCLLMVRDDFWMSVTRFFRELEVPLIDGKNSAAVDLFDCRHASKVLTAFGRAFEALPPYPQSLSEEQQAFVDEAIDALAEKDKVIPVHLALLTEMVKGKTWLPGTLQRAGGTMGVGTAFLEESFSARTAPPEHRLHQGAARDVLKALLPQPGMEIKGQMLSRDELLHVSGYSDRPRDFDELMRLLDNEMRLLTPIDPHEVDSDKANQKHYQLTHDYLVPSLREWLDRKQRETRRGRAELRLAELEAIWSAKPENRRLPGLMDWMKLAALTRHSARTGGQRQMMAQATQHHSLRFVMFVAVFCLASWAVFEMYGAVKTDALIEKLVAAEIYEVPSILDELDQWSRWSEPRLKKLRESSTGSRPVLRASLALVRHEPEHFDFVVKQLLQADPRSLSVMRQCLAGYQDELKPRLADYLDDETNDATSRFRAAQTLSRLNPARDSSEAKVLEKHANFLCDQLLDESIANPHHYSQLVSEFQPIRKILLAPLTAAFANSSAPSRQSMATSVLAEYANDDPEAIINLLLSADVIQFGRILPLVVSKREATIAAMKREIARSSSNSSESRQRAAHRKANAAIALLKLGKADVVWPLLRFNEDPSVRSNLIHRWRHYGVLSQLLVDRLDEEQDVSARRAIWQTIGQFDRSQLGADFASEIESELLKLFKMDPDPGIHASVEWLLRRWGFGARVDEAVEEQSRNLQGNEPWFVNNQKHTMVVLDLRGIEYIHHSFAIATKEATVEQVLRFRPDYEPHRPLAPTDDCPANVVSWDDAVEYCNWLTTTEGLGEDEQCYTRNPRTDRLQQHPQFINRKGYRLPTSAEWHLACACGTVTSHSFGETKEVCGEYAWFSENSQMRLWPAALKKPNDFGLFDMHGNTMEWVNDYREDDHSWLCGGSSKLSFQGNRSDARNLYPTVTKFYSNGFRVAKTMAP